MIGVTHKAEEFMKLDLVTQAILQQREKQM